MDQYRVLVAGMSNDQNPIVRKLRKDYGLFTMHTNQDPGGFPKDANVVIFVQDSLNKSKYKSIKEYYDGRAKLFITHRSFSEIATQFDNFLYESAKEKKESPPVINAAQNRNSGVIRRPKNSFNGLNIPVNWKEQFNETAPETAPQEPVSLTPNSETTNSDGLVYDQAKIYSVIKDCVFSGLSIPETAEMLNLEKLCTKTGRPFTNESVNSIRQVLRNKGELPAVTSKSTKSQTASEEVETVQPVAQPKVEVPPQITVEDEAVPQPHVEVPASPVQSTKIATSDPIGLVLASSATAEEKLDLIHKIHAGVITSDRVISHTIYQSDDGPIFGVTEKSLVDGESYDLEISKFQARYIIDNIDLLKNFASGN